MSLAQVSSEEYILKATTTQSIIHPLPDDDPPRPSPTFCFAAPVSRVVTKESLLREDDSPTTRFEFLPAADDSNNYNYYDKYCSGGSGIDNSDEHSLQSSLFEFSLLDPDGRDDGELLALPLPLTSSVIDGSGSSNNHDNDVLARPTLHNLDTYAALLSFESSSIFPEDSDSSTASSSLGVSSTAAAIVASQQQQLPPQGQEQQQKLSSSNQVVAEVVGSVPSLVAIYPDCSTTSTLTTQPSAVLIATNTNSKTKRASTRGGSRSNNNTTTTRGKKTSVKNSPPVINSIMDQEPLDSSALVPSPPSPGGAGGGGAISTQAPTTTLIGRKYAPPPSSSNQGSGMGVVDPTLSSSSSSTTHAALQYHHNQPPPRASHHHHHHQHSGGTMVTRPRHANNMNMGDHHHHPSSSGVPSPRSSSSSPSENNINHLHHHMSNNTVTTTSGGGGASSENTGRWTAEEHRLFLQGLEQHGKGWKKIATLIQSRTVVQIRTHAQKYFQKLTKAHQAGGEGGVLLVGGGGGGVGNGGNGSGMMGSGVGGTQLISAGTAEGDGTVGIAIPLGPDGLPMVSMRTTTHATSASSSSGNDPSSWAAGAGGEAGASINGSSGRSRRRASHVSGGGTKRRVIGNVVRSAVREGRNVKRQKIAELKRKGGGSSGIMPIPTLADVAPSSSSDPSATSVTGGGGGKEDHPLVPNPLPSVSQILDPYMPPPPPPGAPLAAPPGRVGGRGGGRQQLVHTATHGTLPMAALEDAVFRLLTPATGFPPPPPSQHSHLNNTVVVDPLAPQPNANQVKAPLTHTQYPPLSGGGGGGVGGPTGYPQGMLLNYSPTGVTDMALLPSWVDAKNPPTWYNDGSDIDTLLEDADCLNWLSDTGDLDETYPPAMAEPAAVISSSSTAANSIGAISGQTIASGTSTSIQDPSRGVLFHPSTDSLSFLVDPPEQQHVVEDVNQLPSFLDEPPHVADVTLATTKTATTTTNVTYASATEAVEATTSAPTAAASSASTSIIPEHQLAGVGECLTNLAGFPDLDMGDEQAFVSALLENSGQSVMSFPKLNSDLHICDNISSQKNLALEGGITEEVPEGKVDEYA